MKINGRGNTKYSMMIRRDMAEGNLEYIFIKGHIRKERNTMRYYGCEKGKEKKGENFKLSTAIHK